MHPGFVSGLLTEPAPSCTLQPRLQKVIMYRPLPADELADVRAELARLRLREAQLRALILKDPDLASQGRFARVTVCFHRDRVFDPAVLPHEIRTDPRYFRDRQHWSIQCHDTPQQMGTRPGWPIRRDFGLH